MISYVPSQPLPSSLHKVSTNLAGTLQPAAQRANETLIIVLKHATSLSLYYHHHEQITNECEWVLSSRLQRRFKLVFFFFFTEQSEEIFPTKRSRKLSLQWKRPLSPPEIWIQCFTLDSIAKGLRHETRQSVPV